MVACGGRGGQGGGIRGKRALGEKLLIDEL